MERFPKFVFGFMVFRKYYICSIQNKITFQNVSLKKSLPVKSNYFFKLIKAITFPYSPLLTYVRSLPQRHQRYRCSIYCKADMRGVHQLCCEQTLLNAAPDASKAMKYEFLCLRLL